jgi:hypothetical protein
MLGIEQFEMTGGLNDSPTFIAALADLVAEAVNFDLPGRCGQRVPSSAAAD